jgi:hypothetical protein
MDLHAMMHRVLCIASLQRAEQIQRLLCAMLLRIALALAVLREVEFGKVRCSFVIFRESRLLSFSEPRCRRSRAAA